DTAVSQPDIVGVARAVPADKHRYIVHPPLPRRSPPTTQAEPRRRGCSPCRAKVSRFSAVLLNTRIRSTGRTAQIAASCAGDCEPVPFTPSTLESCRAIALAATPLAWPGRSLLNKIDSAIAMRRA